ncbi:MAG: hypothetical protein KDC10_12300 [Calditrichaeota bacterium]|nr:hypothetical protein [Calditrichota bacterium]
MSTTHFRLADEHLEAAKTIAGSNRRRRSCKLCYDRGWVGIGQDNTIILCHKCVDQEQALTAWKAYVEPIPELWEYYREMFQQEEEEEGPENAQT